MNVSSLPVGRTGFKGGEDAPGHSGRHQPLPTASPTSTTATPCIPPPCHGVSFLPHAPYVPSSTSGLHATTTSSPPAPAQGLPRLDSSRLPYAQYKKNCSCLTVIFFILGIQSIPPQGGKLEIAGMVVGQWAGNKPLRGRGGFNMQVVSVGGKG